MPRPFLAAALQLLLTCHLSAQTDGAFIAWVRDHSVRIDSTGNAIRVLDSSITGARLIGVGESVHETQPFISFRFTLLKDLVRRHRVTALVLESGLPEMMAVDEYVNGRTATIDFGAIPGGYGDHEEFRRVIEWLRSWNLGTGRPHPVSVYGADLSGRAGSMLPALDRLRELTTGLDDIGSRIDSVQSLASKVSSTWWKGAAQKYDSLSASQKADLTSAVHNLVKGVHDLTGGDHNRLEWARRLAILAHQHEAMLRLGAFSPTAPRDQAMAENVLWVLGRLPPEERVVYWAHNAHVQRMPVKGPRLPPGNFPSAGTHLATALGKKYFAIGTAYGGLSQDAQTVADSGSVDGMLEKVGGDQFILALHTGSVSPAVAAWLTTERLMRFQVGYVTVPLGTAFDAVAYFDHAYPAARASSSR